MTSLSKELQTCEAETRGKTSVSLTSSVIDGHERAACTVLLPELLTVVIENLADEMAVGDTSCAADFLRILDRSESQRCLDTVLPAISRSIARFSDGFRLRRLNIQSTLQLRNFMDRALDGRRATFTTEVDLTIDTSTGMSLVPSLLTSLPNVKRLALKHAYLSTLVTQSTFTVRPRALLALNVVHAIAGLSQLEVLVFAPSDSLVCREALVALGSHLPRLQRLHIPRILGRRPPREDGVPPQCVDFPALRTLSVGSAFETRVCTSFSDFVQHTNLPSLVRVNLLGLATVSSIDFNSTMENLRTLETTASNLSVWQGTSKVELLVIHLDSVGTFSRRDWPRLQSVIVNGEMGKEGDGVWEACALGIFDELIAVAASCPTFRLLHVDIPSELQCYHFIIARYRPQFKARNVDFTYKYL